MIIYPDNESIYQVFIKYLPLSLSLFSFIGGIIIIVTHLKFFRLKIYSGKLFLHISIIQLVTLTLFTLSLFYKGPAVSTSKVNSTEESNQDKANTITSNSGFIVQGIAADILSGMGLYATTCLYFYYFFLSHNLYMNSKKRALKNFRTRFRRYLALTHFFALSLTIYAVVGGHLGLGSLGMFGIKMKYSILFIPIAKTVLVIFTIFAILYSNLRHRSISRESIKEDMYERELREDFYKSTTYYLLIFVTGWTLPPILALLEYDNPEKCACIQPDAPLLNILKILSLNLICGSGLGMMFIRLTNPAIRRKFKKYRLSKRQEGNELLLQDENDLENSYFADRGIGFVEDISTLTFKQNNSILHVSALNTCPDSFEVERMTSSSPLKFGNSDLRPGSPPNKKPKPKKAVSPMDHLDILLSLIYIMRNKTVAAPLSYSQLNETHIYTNCESNDIDPVKAFSEEELQIIKSNILKAVTLHSLTYFVHAGHVFDSLCTSWKITPKKLRKSFNVTANMEFFSQIYLKSFSHLEPRFFYTTPDKKILLELIEKDSKIYFIDNFLPHYHRYMLENPDSYLIKILGLYNFPLKSGTYNVMMVLNNYEKFYQGPDREKTNTGIPSGIFERYVINGKFIRNERYSKGKLENKTKQPIADQLKQNIFALSPSQRDRILKQISKDLQFLERHGIINYRVILLTTKDQQRKESLLNLSKKNKEDSEEEPPINGVLILKDGSILKLFIDTNLVTTKMKDREIEKKDQVFYLEDSKIYRQCIDEVMDSLL